MDHLAIYADNADEFVLLEHRHQEHRARGRPFDKAEKSRIAIAFRYLLGHTDNMDSPLRRGAASERRPRAGPQDRVAAALFDDFRRRAVHRAGPESTVFDKPKETELGFADAGC